MTNGKMYMAQKRLNEVIIYCMLADVVLAYILKKIYGTELSYPLVLLYMMNVVVLAGVYRFWKFPVFSWDETGFTFFAVSPFKKDPGTWKSVEAAGFKDVETKKGKVRECLLIVYKTSAGVHKTGVVPMDVVGFADGLKGDLNKLLKHKGIKRI